MSKAKQKGGSLEYAVHQIEELILRHDPTLRGANARIERNRWYVLNPAQPNRAYDIIEPKLRRGPAGQLQGYGLKTFP